MLIGCYSGDLVSGGSAGNPAAVMATGDRVRAPLLWPVEARLAALLPDLLVFRKPRAPEPELATAQGVLLGVHVTGEGEGRRVAPQPAPAAAVGPQLPEALFTAGRPRGTAPFQSRRTPLGMIWHSPGLLFRKEEIETPKGETTCPGPHGRL